MGLPGKGHCSRVCGAQHRCDRRRGAEDRATASNYILGEAGQSPGVGGAPQSASARHGAPGLLYPAEALALVDRLRGAMAILRHVPIALTIEIYTEVPTRLRGTRSAS
jgi:hypothetical protein